jgi:hypothetical protein
MSTLLWSITCLQPPLLVLLVSHPPCLYLFLSSLHGWLCRSTNDPTCRLTTEDQAESIWWAGGRRPVNVHFIPFTVPAIAATSETLWGGPDLQSRSAGQICSSDTHSQTDNVQDWQEIVLVISNTEFHAMERIYFLNAMPGRVLATYCKQEDAQPVSLINCPTRGRQQEHVCHFNQSSNNRELNSHELLPCISRIGT